MPKISELSSETTPADGDLLAIVDIAGVITKKITRDDFLTGTALPNDTVTTAAIADGAVTPAKLALSGSVTTYSNPGAGTGTFYYANIGGIKELWGAFTGLATGSTGTLTLPVGFFTTIQSITVTAGPVSGTAAVQEYINSFDTTSVVIGLLATAGSGTMPVQVFIRGT